MNDYFLKKPKASISVTLSKDTISLGEELTAGLLIKSEEAFDADEIRVEVRVLLQKPSPPAKRDDMIVRSGGLLKDCHALSTLLLNTNKSIPSVLKFLKTRACLLDTVNHG